jgi:hypothetical protein
MCITVMGITRDSKAGNGVIDRKIKKAKGAEMSTAIAEIHIYQEWGTLVPKQLKM